MQCRVFETTEGHLQGGHLHLEIEGNCVMFRQVTITQDLNPKP